VTRPDGNGAEVASVFFSSELQTTTFERSRDFDVDRVTRLDAARHRRAGPAAL